MSNIRSKEKQHLHLQEMIGIYLAFPGFSNRFFLFLLLIFTILLGITGLICVILNFVFIASFSLFAFLMSLLPLYLALNALTFLLLFRRFLKQHSPPLISDYTFQQQMVARTYIIGLSIFPLLLPIIAIKSLLRSKSRLPISHKVTTEKQIQAAHINGSAPLLAGPIQLVDYDPQWSKLFEHEAERIRTALGEQAHLIEHVGSTSIPGLAAKPKIDILLVVTNTADEPSYVPPLEAVGYVLHIREPDWYEHRLFKGPDTDINLHVFSPDCPEIDRMLLFRNWLRNHPEDRQLYERTKRELARQTWKYTQNYADAKAPVVEEILARARANTGKETHEKS